MRKLASRRQSAQPHRAIVRDYIGKDVEGNHGEGCSGNEALNVCIRRSAIRARGTQENRRDRKGLQAAHSTPEFGYQRQIFPLSDIWEEVAGFVDGEDDQGT